MREKAMVDKQYRERLLKYISHLVTETLPPNVSDDDASDREFGFCPFPQPDSKDFELQKRLDIYDLVLSRNMHSKSHSPTCFKYGNTKKCRSKFPRSLVRIPSILGRGNSNGSRDGVNPIETRRCMAEWIQPLDYAHATSQP